MIHGARNRPFLRSKFRKVRVARVVTMNHRQVYAICVRNALFVDGSSTADENRSSALSSETKCFFDRVGPGRARGGWPGMCDDNQLTVYQVRSENLERATSHNHGMEGNLRRNCEYSSGTSQGILSPIPMTRSCDMAAMIMTGGDIRSTCAVSYRGPCMPYFHTQTCVRLSPIKLQNSVQEIQDHRPKIDLTL